MAFVHSVNMHRSEQSQSRRKKWYTTWLCAENRRLDSTSSSSNPSSVKTSNVTLHHESHHTASPQRTSILKRLFDQRVTSLPLSFTDRNTSKSHLKGSNLRERYGHRYRVLGHGTNGTVRVFRRPKGTSYVAIKEYHKRSTKESLRHYRKRLTAEYCIVSTLDHENVIKAFDIFFENNRAYMAMEYCPCDLFHLLSDKMKVQPSQAEIDCYFVQLLDGIRYLHQSGIAHLDLKLENCVISAEGILKIIDFGCAEVVRAPWETQRRPSHNIKGSRPYIAPEVFLNSSYDGQCADAWAVGIMYIAMTERRYPWSVANARLDTTFRDYAAVRHIADKAAPAAAPRAQRTVRFVVSSGTLHTTSFTSIDATSHRSAPTISSPTLLSTPEHATHKPSASEPILPRRTASYMSRLLPTRPEAWSLIAGLLCPDADRRMTIDQAWQDTWVRCVDRCHQGRPSSHHQHHSGGKSKHVID